MSLPWTLPDSNAGASEPYGDPKNRGEEQVVIWLGGVTGNAGNMLLFRGMHDLGGFKNIVVEEMDDNVKYWKQFCCRR